MKDVEHIRSVLEEAISRADKGRYVYGEFDPRTDKRNLLAETEEELLDAINYLAMMILKLRATVSAHRMAELAERNT